MKNLFKFLGALAVALTFGYPAFAAGSKTNWASDLKRTNNQSAGTLDESSAADERNSIRFELVSIADTPGGQVTRVVNTYKYVKAGRAIVQGDILTMDTGSSGGGSDTGAWVLRPLSSTLDTGISNRVVWALGWDQIDSGNFGWVLVDGVCTGVLFGPDTTTAAQGDIVVPGNGGTNAVSPFAAMVVKGDVTLANSARRSTLNALERAPNGERHRVYISGGSQ